jgi:ribosomal protein S18 acetylase RimI-like enzyme
MRDETTVAPATRADATELADLINSAYRGQMNIAGWTNEQGLLAGARADAASLSALLLKPKATILVLRHEAKGRLLGCIAVEPMGDALWYISLLAIDPEQQQYGHGGVLLAAAETFAHERGAAAARMTVIRERETLIAWYERRGYRRTGEVMPFPYDDPSVGTPLRDDLQLVVLEKSSLRSKS